MHDGESLFNELTPSEKGYLLGYFHAKQEEGVYLSDVGLYSLTAAEFKRLVMKAFDVKIPREWKFRTCSKRTAQNKPINQRKRVGIIVKND